MAKHHRHKPQGTDHTDRWYLVARFIVEGDSDRVYFVKTKESSRGQHLSCSCDGYAANLVNGTYACQHTDFCREYVLDYEGGILIDRMPPRHVVKSKKLMDLWVDRHVKTYMIDVDKESS